MTNEDMSPGQIKYSRINETDKQQQEDLECSNCCIVLDDTTEERSQCDHDEHMHNTLCIPCCQAFIIPYMERQPLGDLKLDLD